MTLLAYVLAPVLPLFATLQLGLVNNAEKEAVEPRLPWWLSWFGTFDNSLLGDDGHKERWAGKSRYWQMAAWCARNSAYGWEQSVLAANIKSYDRVSTTGNAWIKNRQNAVTGSYFCRVGDFWNYKLIKPLFGDTALMLEFGWKLQGYAQGRETEGRAMYVFSIRLTAFNL